ncbi:transient-receptor-potential-like protein [Saccoglossus kowalevskii]|uniref:Transient-receptor-potential-like protein-like n=1 Tax=Saccoglossus kowalevskii TaxID=10224 RepID=A0ABM0MU15_SACKO|nr:PREDICTED: transient-receptor-potential-like protein-like [Saccoglossus kowalevskii]
MANSDVRDLCQLTTKEWAYFANGKDGLAPPEAEFLAMVESGDVINTKILLKERYIELKNKVQQYSLDLLNCCGSSDEVSTLMLGSKDVKQKRIKLFLKGKVVTKAIETGHKKLIAHYKCQNVMRKVWHTGQPGWHCRNNFWWRCLYFIYCFIVYVLLVPLLAVIYIIAPCSPVTKILDNPKAKFLMKMVAYFQFIILVILLNIKPEDKIYFETYSYIYSLPFLLIYIVALIWGEIREMMICGLKSFFTSFWNYIDLLILSSFFANISLRIIVYSNLVDINPVGFLFWVTWTAFTLTLACLVFMENFYLCFYLGPMLLIFTAMTGDVIKFLIIFVYAVTAFAFGFYYLYKDFGANNVFSEFSSSFVALISTIFGGNPTDSLKSDDLVFNVTAAGSEGLLDARPMYQTMGFILYASFGTICMLVLLNICIAMMSDTYAKMKGKSSSQSPRRRTLINGVFPLSSVVESARPLETEPVYSTELKAW